MPPTFPESPPQPVDRSVRVDLTEVVDGFSSLRLEGTLDLRGATRLWMELPKKLSNKELKKLEIDASGIEFCDGAGMALLHHLAIGGMTHGVAARLVGLRPEFDTIFKSYSAPLGEGVEDLDPSLARFSIPAEIGATASVFKSDLKEQVSFIGHISSGIVSTLFNRRMMRWPEVLRVFDSAGVNALPIVSLISLLVGLIIAFESSQPLEQFGAQIFIANMIGLVMIRELGPMMTAIILAGRSGSAFAAELGTMKVNEELNALQTMGLDPVRFLVVQRVVAGVLLTPVLTLYSMLMGVLGGVIVMLSLGFPIAAIYNQIVASVALGDIMVGLAKGAVFGVIVSFVGCLRGLQTRTGPSAVGEAATRAVVSGILLIIVADAIFSIFLFLLKK